jgi:hypothetical protein
MSRPADIQSRAQFLSLLDSTKRRVENELEIDPQRRLMKIIQAQLEFMAECTKGGARNPTDEEAARVDVGPLAVKTLEEEDPEFCHWLCELDYAFAQTWKSLP